MREGTQWSGAIAGGTFGAELLAPLGPQASLLGGFIFSIAGGIMGEKYFDKIQSKPQLSPATMNALQQAGATNDDIDYMLNHD